MLVLGTLHTQAERVITHIAGDLYRFQNNFHFSVFLVTPEGLIATDPINAEAVTWLEAEIDKRLDRPIKYLILSHDYADRSSAGEVIADTTTLFAVDFISIRRLPFRTLADSYYPDWVDSLGRVEQLEFDILAPGHGAMSTRQDMVDHRRCHEDFYNAVVAAVRAGQSLEEMKASITLNEYKDWGSFGNWRELNVEGVYARVVLQRRRN